jgi:hypothetical protein
MVMSRRLGSDATVYDLKGRVPVNNGMNGST